ncbi:hypothetical protein DFS34DRAFT_594777 [Phlyctochytrium arcticum]|nr:hypothetical protein DFS34DRAFT_594777 [Phlyctochytrium arcticum]
MGLEDQFRVAQRKGKGHNTGDSTPAMNGRLPREQYQKLREKLRAELAKEMRAGAAAKTPSSSATNSAPSPVLAPPTPARTYTKVETPEEYAKRVSGITCYKCQRKSHVANKCPGGASVNATIVRFPSAAPEEAVPGPSSNPAAAQQVDNEGDARIAALGGKVSPASRFSQGGRSYADAVTAWQDGRRRVKPEKGSPVKKKENDESHAPPSPLLASDFPMSPSSSGVAVTVSVPITNPMSEETMRQRQPHADDKPGNNLDSVSPQQSVKDWKEVVGGPTSVGKVYTIIAQVGGHNAVLLVDPAANVQMLDNRFVKMHRFGRIDHSERRKIGTGFRGSYGTSAAGTVQTVQVLDVSRRVYFEVGAVDGFDGILGTEWLAAVGAQQCWSTDRLVIGGTIEHGVEVPHAQKHKLVRAITAIQANHIEESPLDAPPAFDVIRTISISDTGPAMFPAWAAALEALKEPGSDLTIDMATDIVRTFGEGIGVIRPDNTLPPGLPPLREGMNHTFIMKRDAPPLPKRAIRYPLRYEQQMRDKEEKYERDGRWYRSSDPEAVPTFVVPKKDPVSGRLVFDERARNRQKELVRYTLPNTDGIRDAVQAADFAMLMSSSV